MSGRFGNPYVWAGLMTALLLVAGLPLPAAADHPGCETAPATTCARVTYEATVNSGAETCTVDWKIRVIGSSTLHFYDYRILVIKRDSAGDEINRPHDQTGENVQGRVDKTVDKSTTLNYGEKLDMYGTIERTDDPNFDHDEDEAGYDCPEGPYSPPQIPLP